MICYERVGYRRLRLAISSGLSETGRSQDELDDKISCLVLSWWISKLKKVAFNWGLYQSGQCFWVITCSLACVEPHLGLFRIKIRDRLETEIVSLHLFWSRFFENPVPCFESKHFRASTFRCHLQWSPPRPLTHWSQSCNQLANLSNNL